MAEDPTDKGVIEYAVQEAKYTVNQCVDSKFDSTCTEKLALMYLTHPALALVLKGCSEGRGSDCLRVEATYAGTAICRLFTAGQVSEECGWISNTVIGNTWKFIDGSVQGLIDKVNSTIDNVLMFVGVKDIPSVESALNPVSASWREAKASAIEDFVRSASDAILLSRSGLGVSGSVMIVSPEDFVLVNRTPGNTALMLSVSQVVRGALNAAYSATCGTSKVRSSNIDMDLDGCGTGYWARVNRNAFNYKSRYKTAANMLRDWATDDMRVLQVAMQRAIVTSLYLETKNPATREALVKKSLANRLAQTGLKFSVTPSGAAARVSKMTPFAKPSTPSAAVSDSGGADARMRLFAVGIGMAVAVGIGLALANGEKRR